MPSLEELRKQYRHELVNYWQEWADGFQIGTEEGGVNRDPDEDAAIPGHAIYVLGSKKEWGEAGETALIAQSATSENIKFKAPTQEEMDALKKLADDDGTRGLVRRIGDIYWAFYCIGAKTKGNISYHPEHDNHIEVWNGLLESLDLSQHETVHGVRLQSADRFWIQ